MYTGEAMGGEKRVGTFGACCHLVVASVELSNWKLKVADVHIVVSVSAHFGVRGGLDIFFC